MTSEIPPELPPPRRHSLSCASNCSSATISPQIPRRRLCSLDQDILQKRHVGITNGIGTDSPPPIPQRKNLSSNSGDAPIKIKSPTITVKETTGSSNDAPPLPPRRQNSIVTDSHISLVQSMKRSNSQCSINSLAIDQDASNMPLPLPRRRSPTFDDESLRSGHQGSSRSICDEVEREKWNRNTEPDLVGKTHMQDTLKNAIDSPQPRRPPLVNTPQSTIETLPRQRSASVPCRNIGSPDVPPPIPPRNGRRQSLTVPESTAKCLTRKIHCSSNPSLSQVESPRLSLRGPGSDAGSVSSLHSNDGGSVSSLYSIGNSSCASLLSMIDSNDCPELVQLHSDPEGIYVDEDEHVVSATSYEIKSDVSSSLANIVSCTSLPFFMCAFNDQSRVLSVLEIIDNVALVTSSGKFVYVDDEQARFIVTGGGALATRYATSRKKKGKRYRPRDLFSKNLLPCVVDVVAHASEVLDQRGSFETGETATLVSRLPSEYANIVVSSSSYGDVGERYRIPLDSDCMYMLMRICRPQNRTVNLPERELQVRPKLPIPQSKTSMEKSCTTSQISIAYETVDVPRPPVPTRTGIVEKRSPAPQLKSANVQLKYEEVDDISATSSAQNDMQSIVYQDPDSSSLYLDIDDEPTTKSQDTFERPPIPPLPSLAWQFSALNSKAKVEEASTCYISSDRFLGLASFEIVRDSIDICEDPFSSGMFVTLHMATTLAGYFQNLPSHSKVVVKMLKSDAKARIQKDFMLEMAIMAKLKHENVLSLLGIWSEQLPFLFVTEYCSLGNLKDLLVASTKSDGINLTTDDLIDLSTQAASGLHYVVDYMNIIHGDVSARNFLVERNSEHTYILRLCDFALARKLNEDQSSAYHRDTQRRTISLLWQSPETIFYGISDARSEVWSYGVLLFEIYSNGSDPYGGRMPLKKLKGHLRVGNRLPCPRQCPSWIYERVIKKCFLWKAEARPTFKYIRDVLSSQYNKGQ